MIWPRPRNTEYRPMIAPRSSGYASVTSASRPIAAGVAPGSTNSPPAAIATSASEQRQPSSRRTWLIADAGREHHRAAEDPVEDDRRPAHASEPAAPVEEAGEEQQPADRQAHADSGRGSKPPISSWSENRGSGSRTSWNSVWLVNRPSVALMAIHVGASSQTWEP